MLVTLDGVCSLRRSVVEQNRAEVDRRPCMSCMYDVQTAFNSRQDRDLLKQDERKQFQQNTGQCRFGWVDAPYSRRSYGCVGGETKDQLSHLKLRYPPWPMPCPTVWQEPDITSLTVAADHKQTLPSLVAKSILLCCAHEYVRGASMV